MVKTILSWIIAIFVAGIIMRILWIALGFAVVVFFKLINIFLILIIAIPLYIVIKKKLFNTNRNNNEKK